MERAFGLLELLEHVRRSVDGEEEFDANITGRQYSNVFNSPLLLFQTPKSLSKRDEIISSKTSRMDWSIMLDMSDNLDISETEAFRYVNHAKSSQDVKKLDRMLREKSEGEAVDVSGLDTYRRACEFFFFDCQALLDVLRIVFGVRNGVYSNDDHVMNETKLANFMSFTNYLLKGGIVTKLLDVVLHFLAIIRRCQAGREHGDSMDVPSNERRSYAVKFISKVAVCIYTISFQTQLYEEECRRIVHCIRALSSHMKMAPSQYEGDQDVISALIVLQLTQVRVMSQQNVLLDRNIDLIPYGSNEVGNRLAQYDSKEGLDDVWEVEIVKAFSCLVYGVFRLPSIELQSGGVSTSNMIWFLSEAARLRAFSYIKSCILPFIQTTFLERELQETLMNSLVVDLISPLSHVLSSYSIPCLHTPRTLCVNLLGCSNVDCLDDLLGCFSSVGAAYPRFASIFWVEKSRPAPFITRIVEEKITDGENYLDAYIPIMHFLSYGACGSGRNVDATSCVFQYFFRDLAVRHPWISTFKIMENLTQSFKSIDEDTLENAIYTYSPYLLVTLNFITTTMQELQEGDSILNDDPITKLFDLFVSPVHSELKGAALRALAAIVQKNSLFVEDVWHVLEESHLLFPAMQLGSSSVSSLTAQFGTMTDLKNILEQTECTEGKYDVTDGFLILLDALLEYGIPEKLGIGSRRPGVLVYLEYIINEIILKAPERSYEYSGERWKVTARALQVLRRILLKYPINAVQALRSNTISSVSDDEDDHPVVPDAVCKTIEFDFHEESEVLQTYEIFTRGEKSQQDWPTPKSAGFAVMTWLLQGGRLLESIFSILEENQQSIVLEVEKKIGDTLRDVSSQIYHIFGSKVGVEGIDNFGSSVNGVICDATYWRKAVVSTAVGILYECSRKEQSFLGMVNNADCHLTVITTVDMRPSRQPVRPYSLAELLLSHPSMATPPILLIAQYIKPGTYIGVSGKSLSFMCSALLKHVASLQNLDAFTYALSGDSVGLERLRRGCINILQISETSTRKVYVGDKEQSVFPISSDVLYDDPVFKDKHAISESVLKLILGTLYPGKLSMSHFLLGLDADILVAAMSRDKEEGFVSIHPLKLSAQLPDLISGNPSNCLEAVVDLVCPSDQDSDYRSIICTSPAQARLCLEIIYRLVSSATTCEVVLALLRKTDGSMNVFDRVLRICMEQVGMLSSKRSDLTADSEQAFENDIALSNVHQCISYVLKICSIELHTLSQAAAVYVDNIEGMMSLLVPEAANNERGLPPILQLLSSINFDASCSCNHLISSLSSDLKDCMKSSVVIYETTHGIPASSLANEPPSPLNGFFQVAKDRLNYFLRNTQPIQHYTYTMMFASKYNCLQQQAAAAFHVGQAVKQFISIAVLECPMFFLSNLKTKSLGNDGKKEGSAVELERLVEFLIVPTIEVISVYPNMDNEISDEMTMTLLSLVDIINHASQQSLMLIPTTLERIIRSLLAALLSTERKVGVTRLSERSRSNLYTCILHLLRYPSNGNYATPSQGTTSFQTYRLCGMKTLEPVATILVDKLGQEIYSPKTSDGAICSLSATSLLSVVLSTLGPCTSDHLIAGKATNENFRVLYGSHVFLQCIQVLASHGHIAQIVNNMNWKLGRSSSDDIALQWILAMFTNLAMGEIGVQLLIDAGIAEKILGMERFFHIKSNSTVFPGDERHISGNSEGIHATDKLLLILINLLRTMAMSSPHSQETIRLCTDFLHSNYNTISQTLSIENANYGSQNRTNPHSNSAKCSLSDLELIESIVALCSVVAAPGGSMWLTRDTDNAWSSGLGQHAQPLYEDISNLLSILGRNICKGQDNGRDADCWYNHVVGSNDIEVEQMNTPAERPSLVKALKLQDGEWNVLDNRILDCTLRILKYSAMALRFWCAELHDNADFSFNVSNSALSFPHIAEVFVNTSNLLLKEIEVAENGNDHDFKVEGNGESVVSSLSSVCKPEDSLVERALLFISENLICVMHSQITCFGINDISNNIQHIERVLDCAENFNSQSLIFRTGRFMKQKTIDGGTENFLLR